VRVCDLDSTTSLNLLPKNGAQFAPELNIVQLWFELHEMIQHRCDGAPFVPYRKITSEENWVIIARAAHSATRRKLDGVCRTHPPNCNVQGNSGFTTRPRPINNEDPFFIGRGKR
jgi:hypothetical protein